MAEALELNEDGTGSEEGLAADKVAVLGADILTFAYATDRNTHDLHSGSVSFLCCYLHKYLYCACA